MITMTKPIDSSRKSDRKLKTEEGNPKFRSQRNLSKDHDRGSDSERTWRPRHVCGFLAAKWTNTSPEQPTGAINLVWAIHHFPYHLKMSFGPARRLGLGSLGRDNGTRYPDPSVALDPNSFLSKVVRYGLWSQWPNPLIPPENLILEDFLLSQTGLSV